MLDRIRVVFADAQTEGMDQLYDVINAARDLAPDSDFQACYDLVMASGGSEVETWINFTVMTATRFDLGRSTGAGTVSFRSPGVL